MVLNKDFRAFIELLNQNDVKYLIVGGYAVGFHGYPRYTKDLDIWVWVDPQNAESLIKSLNQFGFSQSGLEIQDFLEIGQFVQLGQPPNRIDLITSCDGLDFESCYPLKVQVDMQGILVSFIDYESLLINKRATARPQDWADIDNLMDNNK